MRPAPRRKGVESRSSKEQEQASRRAPSRLGGPPGRTRFFRERLAQKNKQSGNCLVHRVVTPADHRNGWGLSPGRGRRDTGGGRWAGFVVVTTHCHMFIGYRATRRLVLRLGRVVVETAQSPLASGDTVRVFGKCPNRSGSGGNYRSMTVLRMPLRDVTAETSPTRFALDYVMPEAELWVL